MAYRRRVAGLYEAGTIAAESRSFRSPALSVRMTNLLHSKFRESDRMTLSVRDAAGPRKGLQAHPCLPNSSTFFRPDASGQRAANERRPPCPTNRRRIPFPNIPISDT
jgi:hypothetical protein